MDWVLGWILVTVVAAPLLRVGLVKVHVTEKWPWVTQRRIDVLLIVVIFAVGVKASWEHVVLGKDNREAHVQIDELRGQVKSVTDRYNELSRNYNTLASQVGRTERMSGEAALKADDLQTRVQTLSLDLRYRFEGPAGCALPVMGSAGQTPPPSGPRVAVTMKDGSRRQLVFGHEQEGTHYLDLGGTVKGYEIVAQSTSDWIGAYHVQDFATCDEVWFVQIEMEFFGGGNQCGQGQALGADVIFVVNGRPQMKCTITQDQAKDFQGWAQGSRWHGSTPITLIEGNP